MNIFMNASLLFIPLYIIHMVNNTRKRPRRMKPSVATIAGSYFTLVILFLVTLFFVKNNIDGGSTLKAIVSVVIGLWSALMIDIQNFRTFGEAIVALKSPLRSLCFGSQLVSSSREQGLIST